MDPLAVDQPEDFSDRRGGGAASKPADYSSNAVDKLRLFAERQEKSSSLYHHPENDNKSAFKSGSSNAYGGDKNLASALGGPSQLGYPYFGQYNPYQIQQLNRPSAADKLEIFPSSDVGGGGITSQSASATTNKRSSDKLEIFASEGNPDKPRDKYSYAATGDMSRNFSMYSNQHQQESGSAADHKAERFPPCAQTPVKKLDVFSQELDQLDEAFPPQTPKKSNDDIFIDGEHRRPKTEDCDDETPQPNLKSKKEIFSSDENEMAESDKFEFFSSYGKKLKDKMESFSEDGPALKPQDIVLDYLKSREKSSYCHRFDAVLWSEEGSLKIHRLILAASSPLLASSMWEDSEDIESIFVERASMRGLKEAGKFLYEGGHKPSEECVEILNQLGITASGLNKQWKGKSRTIEVKPDLSAMDDDGSSLDREKYVKDEPDELGVDDNILLDDEEGESVEVTEHRGTEHDLPEGTDKSTLLGIQIYFTPSEAGYEFLQCSLCFMTVRNTESSMLQHFNSHPDELDKIKIEVEEALKNDEEGGGTVKKTKASKIWDFFDRLDGGQSICTTCGKTLNTVEGSTSQLVYHLKSKHHEEYQEYNKHKGPVGRPKGSVAKKDPNQESGTTKVKLTKEEKAARKAEKMERKRRKRQKMKVRAAAKLEFSDEEMEEEGDDGETGGNKERKLHKRRSYIWFYFKKQTEEDIECKVCRKIIMMSKSSRGSTTLLIQHLRCKHAHEYKVFQAMKGKAMINKQVIEEIDQDIKLKSLPKGSTLTLDELNGDGIKKEVQEKIAKSKGSMAWLHFANVPGDPTSAVCNSCQVKVEGVTSVDVLLEHLRFTHMDIYEVVYNPQDTKLSQKAVDMELTMCEFCSETFPRAKMMLHIYAVHFEEWANNYKDRFDRVRAKLNQLAIFGPFYKYLTAHYVFENDPITADNGDNEDDTAGGECKICYVFVQKDINSLETHLKFFHPEIDVSERMPTAYWIMASNQDKEVGCNICGDTFRKEHLFVEHIKDKHKCEHPDIMDWNDVLTSHSSNDNFKVAVLLEKYDKTNNYWEHGKLPLHGEYARLDDSIFRTCIECKKVFASSSSMRYHQRVVHSGEKPFKCNMCDKVFNRNDTLQTHIASHSDLKPFMCSVCGKQFGRRHVRDTHERRHKGDRRYPCHLCVKKFASSQQLKNHIRVHTGEKPFSCEHCGRMFAVKHQLVTHLRVHTGEKPYDCTKCSQKFKHLSTRRNHKCFGGGGGSGGGDGAPPDRKQEPGVSSEHGGENPGVSPQHNALTNPRDIRDQLFRLPLNQAYPMGL